MKTSRLFLASLIGLFSLGTAFADDSDMREAVHRASSMFEEKQASAHPIPQAVLDHARALGFIEITKGALGVGGANGEGVIVSRVPDGWSAPFAFTQGGGSIGFQVGVDIKRYIYVFNTEAAYHAFTGPTRGRFQADAKATAGPDSASQIAARGLPDSPMYIYSLSDGAFAGVSVGGQLVGGAPEANKAAYGTDDPDAILHGKVPVPAYAGPLNTALSVPAGPPTHATMKPGGGT